jgi:hypothetical protein
MAAGYSRESDGTLAPLGSDYASTVQTALRISGELDDSASEHGRAVS